MPLRSHIKIVMFFLLAVTTGGISLTGCAPLVVGGVATGVVIAHDRRSPGVIIDDQAIMISALNAFRDDPLISTEDHINVTSYGFHVLLTGETTSAASRKRAAELVSHLPDVKKVYNELTTLPLSSLSSRSHDTWLTTKVKSAFLKIELPDFDPTRVKVVTERNIVYLMGLVTREEATAAAQTAAGVGGITKVVTLFEYLD